MDSINIKFSIIIPAYNSESYLDTAIKSVLDQTYGNFQLIIVNDGSTDNTLTIVEKYAQQDKRINVYSKSNGGYVSAVNYGLDHINGDYFLFLGSDDYLDIHLFETIVNAIRDVSPDIIVFKSLRISNEKEEMDEYSNYDQTYLLNDNHLFEKIQSSDNGLGLLCNRDTSKAFSTSLLSNQRYYGKTGLAADDVFTMRLARRSKSVFFISIVGYYWTIRPDSIGGKERSIETKVDIIKVFYNYLAKLPKDAALNSFELGFLCDYFYIITQLIKSFSFVFKHYILIKRYGFLCYRKVRKYRHIKIRHLLEYFFPLIYCLFTNLF